MDKAIAGYFAVGVLERFPCPREVLNGILWALRTGAQWKDLPDRCPPHQTCHRRFLQQWTKAGLFRRIIEESAADLQVHGGIDLREAFIDGSFVPAKKGAMRSEGHKTRQRELDHGNCGRCRSSCRRLPCKCFDS